MTTEHDLVPSKERSDFDKWLDDTHGLSSEWDEKRGCYVQFAAHLAWKAWRQRDAEIERLRAPLSRIAENDCPCGELAGETLAAETGVQS